MKRTQVKVIAHKGASRYAPENTRAALERALELGVDAIEIDIRMTKDGNLVVFHDPYLSPNRTGHDGPIASKMLKELKEIDIGSWFGPGFKGERILTLEEALDLVQDRAELIIELKRTRNDPGYEGFEERVVELLKHKSALERVLVSSFDHRSLLDLKRLEPKLRVGMLFGANWLNLWEETEMLKPEAIHPHWAFTTGELIAEAHRKGLVVNAWVVNEEGRMRELIEQEIDGLITDYPDRLLRILERHQGQRTAVRGG